jgi:hypothetical protein
MLVASNDWYITFSTAKLKSLGYSVQAQRLAQISFEKAHELVLRRSPFEKILDSTCLSEPSAALLRRISGKHLQFGRGRGSHPKQLLRYQVATSPQSSSRLILIVPEHRKGAEEESLRTLLRAHLLSRYRLVKDPQAARLADHLGKSTIVSTWQSTGVPAFQVGRGDLFVYQPETGRLRTSDQHRFEKALTCLPNSGTSVVALVIVDEIGKRQKDALLRTVRERVSCLAVRSATLRIGKYGCVNLTAKLLGVAGVVPWHLVDLPGVQPSTIFLGIDLWHDHARDRSILGLTMFDSRGRLRAKKAVHLGSNNERIPAEVLSRGIPQFVRSIVTQPSQLIVHRDGRFHTGELQELEASLAFATKLSLVGVKKDTCTRFGGEVSEGITFQLSQTRALVITNTQAAGKSMPVPVEVEVHRCGGLTLEAAVSQVFWLSRVYRGSIYHSKHLPVTTDFADQIASTGNERVVSGLLSA